MAGATARQAPVQGRGQAYANELNTIAERYGKLEGDTVKRMLGMLRDLRNEIAAEITSAENFDLYRLGQMEQNIARLADQFESRLAGETRDAFDRAYRDGGEFVTAPLATAGIEGAFFRPNAAQLNTLLDFSARLVKNIADETRIQIDRQIRASVLGQQTPFEAMRAVTQALGIEARTGIWKKRPDPVQGVAARAETDLRTEMQRVFNVSAHAQQLDSAARIPGLTKSWMATVDGRTRRGHLEAHLHYKDHPIPIDEPFRVRDIDDRGRVRGTAELMYPGDPSAPARYTVNCRCRMATHHPAIGRVGSSLDGRVAAELQRRMG